MEFYEVVKTRRSIRAYKSDPIPEDVLIRVLEAMRIAPSGSNRQPWKFILVKGNDLKKKVGDACGNMKFVSDAPSIVVACGQNIHYNRGGYMGDQSMLIDVSIAMTHLILAARAEGLGTCWIGAFDNEKLKDIIGIPEDVNVVAISPIGYPKQGFSGPGARKQIEEIVSTDKY